MKRLLLLSLSLGAGLAAASAQVTPSDVWKLDSGFGYTRGSYGLNTDTEVWFVPFGVAGDGTDWAFSASTSYLTIKGPAAAVNGIEIIRPTAQAESGLGDTMVSGSWKVLHEAGQLQVALTGKVKLPTADYNKGLGTGASDYTLQLDLLQTFGTVTPFGSVGYRWLGSHGVYQLTDGAFFDAGAAFKVEDGTSVGAFYEWDEKIAHGAADASQVTAFFFHKFDAHWSANFYGLAGFTDASPSWGGGFSLMYAF
ncbi:MAG TPA: hypothetical protein VHC86_15510 [Opitutaceae bacterium]|nr:hypothetical protein [Opitutaceae bacterium]